MPFLPHCEKRTAKLFAWFFRRKLHDVNGPLWPLEEFQLSSYERDAGRGGGDRTRPPNYKVPWNHGVAAARQIQLLILLTDNQLVLNATSSSRTSPDQTKSVELTAFTCAFPLLIWATWATKFRCPQFGCSAWGEMYVYRRVAGSSSARTRRLATIADRFRS